VNSFHLWLALSLIPFTALTADEAGSPSLSGSQAHRLRPPYLERDDQVQRRHDAYQERLERFFKVLDARLAEDAPELRAGLAPPTPVVYGYGILPKLTPEPPRAAGPWRVASPSFSWKRTDGHIDRALVKLDALEAQFAGALRLPSEDRSRRYGELVEEYKQLVASQKLIGNLIHYNRLWQGEIARHPRVYDDLTALYDAAVERQTLVDAMTSADDRTKADVRARVDALSRRLDEATRKLPAPGYLRIDRPSAHRYVFRMPVYTDIENGAFLEWFRTAVEKAWQLRDGGDEFNVILEIRPASPAELYPDGRAPAHGTHIDLVDHTRRFPADGAVLTTGANTTQVRGRNIIIGPNEVAPHDIAHEFGHILGFRDGYFRGYRDRGPDGYEVLEIIFDPDDIMAAPGHGRVLRKHFDQLLAEKRG
jgi:hypothetical protein